MPRRSDRDRDGDTMTKRRRVQPPPQKSSTPYRRLWRVVEAAVVEAFKAHPDYLAPAGRSHSNAVRSITKRVTGQIIGYAEESAKRRSGPGPAPDNAG